MQKILKNQVTLISGGLGDIGRAIATLFAEQGAHIALADLKPPPDAQDFLHTLAQHNIRTHYTQLDIANPTQVQSWITQVEQDLGPAQLIIPNAAIVTLANFQSITADQWTRELSINLSGAFHMAQAATKRLIDLKLPGRVIFIGSWAAHAPHPRIPAYCVAKAGLRMLAQCMALELAPHNILVNEVAPGYVDAGLTAQLFQKNPGSRERARDRVPIKKLITPDQVAQQVLHLANPTNQHMTGATLLMDGGLSLLTPATQ